MCLIKKGLAIYVLILILLISCRRIIFNEDISFTIEVAERMTSKAVVGPLTIPGQTYDENEDEVYFIPAKGLYNEGFIIWKKSDKLTIWYVDAPGVLSNSIDVTLDTCSEHGLDIFIEPITGNAGQLFFINFNKDDIDNEKTSIYDIAYYEGNTLSWRFGGDHYNLSEFLADEFGGDRGWDPHIPIYVNGAYISPHTNRLYLLCYDGYLAGSSSDTYRYYEFSFAMNSDGVLSDDHALRCADNGSYWINLYREMRYSFFYAYDSITNKGFACFYNDDFHRYETYTWDTADTSGGLIHNINIQKHVRHLLSKSRLYARQSGIVDIYDDNGHKLYSFPSGKLRLNYEYYNDGGYFSMVFSYTEVLKYNQAKFNFYVLTHKTKDIDELDW
jgi:hypothetical protein